MALRRLALAIPVLLLWAAVLPAGARAEAGERSSREETGGEKAGGGDPEARIDAVEIAAGGRTIEVSFSVEAAFDARIQEKLESGLKVVFRHQVEVRRRRTLWFSRTLAQKKIVTSAVLDHVTLQYTLTRMIDEATVDTFTSTDPGEMKAFMTRVEGVRLELPEGAQVDDERTEVRVRSKLETRFFAFFPYDHKTDWARWPLAAAAGETD